MFFGQLLDFYITLCKMSKIGHDLNNTTTAILTEYDDESASSMQNKAKSANSTKPSTTN
jgi:hypothetical protein